MFYGKTLNSSHIRFAQKRFRSALSTTLGALLIGLVPPSASAEMVISVVDASNLFPFEIIRMDEGVPAPIAVKASVGTGTPDACPGPPGEYVVDVTVDVEAPFFDNADRSDFVGFPRTVRLDSSALCTIDFSYPTTPSGRYTISTPPPYDSIIRYSPVSPRLDGIHEGSSGNGGFNEFEDVIFVVTAVTPVSGSMTYSVDSSSVPGTASASHRLFDGNNAPVFTSGMPPTSATASVGQTLILNLDATDFDTGDLMTFSVSNQPSGSTLTNPGPFSGMAGTDFQWTPGLADQGSHNVTFIINDNASVNPMQDQTTVTISVGIVNQPPVLDPISDQNISEGQALLMDFSASDPDGNSLSFQISGEPSGSVFMDNGDGSASLSWTPEFGQAGNYPLDITVSDNDPYYPLSDVDTFNIHVGDGNRPPVLDPIGGRLLTENVPFHLDLIANDPDGDAVTFSASDLPTGAMMSTTGRFDWTPGFDQAGNHSLIFHATDNGSPPLTDSETVILTVGNVNRPPLFNAIGNKSVNEGETLSFVLSAYDPDMDSLSFFYTGSLPVGAALSGNRFTWTPGFDQGGQSYPLNFTVSDGEQGDSVGVVITVGNVNVPPVLQPVGNRSVNEVRNLRIPLSATDRDGDSVSFSVVGDLPPGAMFDNGIFDWTPELGQSGDFTVEFRVDDDGVPSLHDSEAIQIRVFAQGDVNLDGSVDSLDVELVFQNARLPVTDQNDQLDVNGDGVIDMQDARLAAMNCGRPDCAVE